MHQALAPHIKLTNQNAILDMPQLRLTLSASKMLSLTLPFEIYFRIEHQDPLTAKNVILEWSLNHSGFLSPGLVLFRHTADSLEPIAIDHTGLVDTSRHGPMVVNGWNPNLWELSPDGALELHASLPGRYQTQLRAGETYTLLWPGCEITLWEYGTMHEHIGGELDDKPSPLILPGGPYLSFSTYTESQPWPERAEREARVGFDRANDLEQEWRWAQNRPKPTYPPAKKESDPNAPIITVSLDCASSLRSDDILNVNVKVTYEAEATARPITFHARAFEDYDYYQLGRLHNGVWENSDNSSTVCGGFPLVEDPDVSVPVGLDSHFINLQPGESWTTLQRIGYNGIELPDDAEDDESFSFVFRGTTLDWWNWGLKTDHTETIVKLPCWLSGPVTDPKNNDGRPRLVVQPSDVVRFSFKK